MGHFNDRQKPVRFTRSRSYHKNDSAHVEQKNWTHVRQLLGYDRLENPGLVDVINELYMVWEKYNNFFCPSMKRVLKKRIKGRYTKKYDRAKTPYERLVQSQVLTAQKGKSGSHPRSYPPIRPASDELMGPILVETDR